MGKRMKAFSSCAKSLIKRLDNWADSVDEEESSVLTKEEEAMDYLLSKKEYKYSHALLCKEREDNLIEQDYRDNYRVDIDLAEKHSIILEDVRFSGRIRRIEARNKAKMTESRLSDYDKEAKILKDAGMDYLGMDDPSYKYPDGRKEANQTWFEYFFNTVKPGEEGYMSEDEINSNDWLVNTTFECSMFYPHVATMYELVSDNKRPQALLFSYGEYDFDKIMEVFEEFKKLNFNGK